MILKESQLEYNIKNSEYAGKCNKYLNGGKYSTPLFNFFTFESRLNELSTLYPRSVKVKEIKQFWNEYYNKR